MSSLAASGFAAPLPPQQLPSTGIGATPSQAIVGQFNVPLPRQMPSPRLSDPGAVFQHSASSSPVSQSSS
eukprot:2826709-Rhodomonas_salina.1